MSAAAAIDSAEGYRLLEELSRDGWFVAILPGFAGDVLVVAERETTISVSGSSVAAVAARVHRSARAAQILEGLRPRVACVAAALAHLEELREASPTRPGADDDAWGFAMLELDIAMEQLGRALAAIERIN